MFRPLLPVAAVLFASVAGCDRRTGSASCGLDALTGALAVKQSFAEGHVLTALPDSAPPSLAVRLVVGPAWNASVTSDSGSRWRVMTHGTVSREAQVGYGVAIVDYHDNVLGVLAFNGHSVRGAPALGTLVIGDTVVPLLGVRIDPAAVQSPRCPIFPDSLR
jgi:hypothetical protein